MTHPKVLPEPLAAGDAYLAALAIENGCLWVSADRGFARYPGLRHRHPLAERE